MIEFQQYKDPRILGITVKSKSELYFSLSVYMSYQCLDNKELYIEYIGKICAIVEDLSKSNVILLGDFNADINTLFETKLLAMCVTLNRTILVILLLDVSLVSLPTGAMLTILSHGSTMSFVVRIYKEN